MFDLQRDHYEPKKLLVPLTIIIFNMKVLEMKAKH